MATTQPIIDVDQLRRTTSGDSELLAELITVFQQELPRIESSILTGRINHDGLAISTAAHKLKGSLLVLGANCASMAERLEIRAREGCGADVQDLSTELGVQLAQVIPALQSLLQTGAL